MGIKKRFYVLNKNRFLGICAAILLVSALCGFATSSVYSAVAARLIPIYSVETSEKKIAVTFDAAWGESDTAELIEILARHNARATFFVVGEWAQRCALSVKALHGAGHSIQNHSDSHAHWSKLGRGEIINDILACNKRIQELTGTVPTLVRAPYGEYCNTSIEAADSLKMKTVQWDVDSLDWKGKSVEEITQRVVTRAAEGSILLFHNDVKNTPAALDAALTELEKEGFVFVTAEELIIADNYTIDHAGRQKAKSG